MIPAVLSRLSYATRVPDRYRRRRWLELAMNRTITPCSDGSSRRNERETDAVPGAVIGC